MRWNKLSEEDKAYYSKLIDAYLPHQRDDSLEWDEYYVIGGNDGKCYRVRVLDVLCGNKVDTFGCYTSNKLRWVDAGYNDKYIGFTKASMYDNKQDCLDGTHGIYDCWEMLRELREERDNDKK